MDLATITLIIVAVCVACCVIPILFMMAKSKRDE